VNSFEDLPRIDKSATNVGFWKTHLDPETDTFKASLDVDAVVRNAVENMRRLEEQATLKVVVEYLRSVGYTVIEPHADADA
jgi:hypothetical protein